MEYEKAMKIIVNGMEETLENECSLIEFFERHDLKPGEVVVELNCHIIPGDTYEQVILKENDNLEILRFVGGG